MYVLNATRFTLVNRRFLTLLVKSTNSTNVLVANLNRVYYMMFTKKGALKRLFLRPGIGPYVARSQGWRCDECTGMCCIPQRARKAMRLRPWIGPYVARSQGWRCDECTRMRESTVTRKESVESSQEQRPRVTQERLPRWRYDRFTHIHLMLIVLTLVSTSPSLASTTLAQTNCSSEYYDETSQVRYIHDGDTLHLTDGRKVRLIGINTPELARDNRPAEAYSEEAKKTLESLFKKDKSISLVSGKDKKDRYGRYLAHAFLSDNTNVQSVLLERGLGSAIAIPPNTRFSACYIEREHIARCNKAGLWSNTGILKAKNLNKQHSGFHLIKGTVNSIKTDNKGIWLNLDDKLTVGIRPENQNLFDLKAINNMANQTIIVRGWINKSKKSNPYYLRVRHPLSIQPFSSHSCE